MQRIKAILAKYGLTDKETSVYLALLKLGPAPVRKVALESKINRGTTYDILRSLRDQGLASYYHKETRQYFVAEDPKKFFSAIKIKQDYYKDVKREFKQIMPKLRSLDRALIERPTVAYYDGLQGIRSILQDVLDTVEIAKQKIYYVYSSATIKSYLYAAYPDYSEQRVERNIKVQAISIGAGGQEIGLDERKWLTNQVGAPTYTLVYIGKMAMISTNKNKMPIGLIVEDDGIYETQKLIFESLWKKI